MKSRQRTQPSENLRLSTRSRFVAQRESMLSLALQEAIVLFQKTEVLLTFGRKRRHVLDVSGARHLCIRSTHSLFASNWTTPPTSPIRRWDWPLHLHSLRLCRMKLACPVYHQHLKSATFFFFFLFLHMKSLSHIYICNASAVCFQVIPLGGEETPFWRLTLLSLQRLADKLSVS